MNNPCLYILASKKNGTLYVGSTNNLLRRIEEHKNKINKDGFSAKYKVNQLVYFEKHLSIEDAMTREKQIKKWNRKWKIELIEKENPEWTDLLTEKSDKVQAIEILSGKKLND